MSWNTILLQLVLDLRKKILFFLDQQLENQTTWIFFLEIFKWAHYIELDHDLWLKNVRNKWMYWRILDSSKSSHYRLPPSDLACSSWWRMTALQWTTEGCYSCATTNFAAVRHSSGEYAARMISLVHWFSHGHQVEWREPYKRLQSWPREGGKGTAD